MEVVCIKNCKSYEEYNIYEYYIGKNYSFNLSSYRYTCLFLHDPPILLYMGSVEYDFIEKNFIPKDDFYEILDEIDKLYNKCFNCWI